MNDLKTKLETTIDTLLEKAVQADSSVESMQYAQAALSAMQGLSILKDTGLIEDSVTPK